MLTTRRLMHPSGITGTALPHTSLSYVFPEHVRIAGTNVGHQLRRNGVVTHAATANPQREMQLQKRVYVAQRDETIVRCWRHGCDALIPGPALLDAHRKGSTMS